MTLNEPSSSMVSSVIVQTPWDWNPKVVVPCHSIDIESGEPVRTLSLDVSLELDPKVVPYNFAIGRQGSWVYVSRVAQLVGARQGFELGNFAQRRSCQYSDSTTRNDEKRGTETGHRIRPPRDLVKLEDRLYYVFCSPRSNRSCNRRSCVFPFIPFRIKWKELHSCIREPPPSWPMKWG